MKKQILSVLLKYGIGLCVLAWVVQRNWDGIKSILEREAYWPPFGIALVLGMFSVFLTFVRWFVLVRALDLPFRFYDAVRLGCVGLFFNSFLPGSVTGDIPKAAFLARGQSRRTAAVATVIMDRGLGLCGLVWLVALLGSIFWMQGTIDAVAKTDKASYLLHFIIAGSVGLFVGSVVSWFLLGFVSEERSRRIAARLERLPKVGTSVAELWRAVMLYRARGKQVLLAITLAMIGHIGFVFILFLCSHTLNPPDKIPSLETHFLIVPIGVTVQSGFPAPGGIGGGELAFSWLYAQVGAGPDSAETTATTTSPEGFLAAFLNHCLFWILGLLAYLVFLSMRPAQNALPTEPVHAAP